MTTNARNKYFDSTFINGPNSHMVITVWNCQIPSGNCKFIMISVPTHNSPQKTSKLGNYKLFIII